MRLLLVHPHPLLPANIGPKLFTLELLRYLAQRHECHLVGFHDGSAAAQEGWRQVERSLPVKVLATFPERAGGALLRARAAATLRLLPWSLGRWDVPEARAFLAALPLGEYDAVLLDIFPMVQFAHLLRARPRVVLGTDAISMGLLRATRDGITPAFRARHGLEAALQLRLERGLYQDVEAVACVSPVDVAFLGRLSRNVRARHVPIPLPAEVLGSPPCQEGGDPPRLLSWIRVNHEGLARGLMRFVAEGWPRVRARHPGARLVVWGPDPVPALRGTLAAPGVEHLAYVDDWVGELRRGGVFLYPARAGSGVQTKVQAALGLGLPAVLPPEVAAALGVAAGRDALVCGSPADMGDACARLLADRAERQRLGAAGMALARATFTPERAGSALVAVLEEAIQLRGAGRKAAPAAAGGGAA